ncbi:hypothetical protein [Blastomonas sp.]|uniref:hypothetical protein n=1 Tax=Blastomonas sp. TaxID=1909299 RepID=UPI00391A5314
MSFVILPERPGPADVQWQYIDFGGNLPGGLGGPEQRVNRLGNRWACTVILPKMEEHEARYWIAALTRGVRLGVRWKLRQRDLDIGSPGSPVILGDGQAGDMIAIGGMTPNYPLRVGQWFNHVQDGKHYLYKVSGPGDANADGEVIAQVEPPFRAEGMDGDVLLFGAPVIEGSLTGNGLSWTVDNAIHTGLQFGIRERR